jgi:hypothetical protein
MLTAALFITGSRTNLVSSMSKCIKKMWYMYEVEYYTAIKKNEILSFEATWMNLGTFHCVRYARHRQTDTTYHMFSLRLGS